jgi:thymidylate synthase (FAD)
MDIIYNTYNKLIKDGVKKEDARFILPNACTTNLKIKMNLRNWFHFFYERSCYKAQWEIRIVSDLILELLVTKYSLNENILKIFIDAGQKCLKLGYCPNNCSKVCPRFRKRSFNVVF